MEDTKKNEQAQEPIITVEGVEDSPSAAVEDSAEEIGEIKIAEDVVQTVAGMAVAEVKGITVVNSLTDGFVEKFVKKNYGKGVRVLMGEGDVCIDIHVVVDYGLKIPDVAWELQETVKKNIETMTNLTCSKVNIFVEGINLEKERTVKEAEEQA